MPRLGRIDIPDHLYHVMSRGIERRRIFIDDHDYSDFYERIAVWLERTGGKCLAWCLMPNHFHILVLRGELPLSEMMHHAMTGYAVNFNLRHGRAGHLFQNRYKAIMCDLERYLLELVPYIHLNPLRAGLVEDLAGLKDYKWCGHAAAAGGVPDGLLDRGELLAHFANPEMPAVEKYMRVMAEKAAAECTDLSGGGLLRSFGGERTVLETFKKVDKVFSDERILGDSAFVESILRNAGEVQKKDAKTRAEVLSAVENMTGIEKEEIFRHTHERGAVQARAIYCFLCAKDADSTGSELASELCMTRGAISKLVAKGRGLAKAQKLGS